MQKAVQILEIREDLRADKIQQGKQLLEVVLERCTRDEETATAGKDADDLGEDGIDVFDTVGFVNDDVVEGELFEGVLLAETHFVGGDTDFELLREEAFSDDHRLKTLLGQYNYKGTYILTYPLVLRASQNNDIKVRNPFSEFACPVLESTLRNYDQMRSGHVSIVLKITKKRNGL